MNRLHVSVCLALAFVGCDSSDKHIAVDALMEPDSTPHPGCNPAAKVGCNEENGERCTFVLTSEDPVTGVLDCKPAGPTSVGGSCEFVDGVDNCQAGAWCDLETLLCVQLCDMTAGPENCEIGACTSFENGEFAIVPAIGFCSV
jgi:hypothetical protein